MSAIHSHLGVCPQFNVQYPELSAEEHLLFYARLKGVRWNREMAVVKRALKKVKGRHSLNLAQPTHTSMTTSKHLADGSCLVLGGVLDLLSSLEAS